MGCIYPRVSPIKGTQWTLQNKGQILAASEITRPTLRNSDQDNVLLMRTTDQSPGDGPLNFLAFATKMHIIGQIFNFLAPTQPPDVNKHYLQSTALRNIKNPQFNFGSSTKWSSHVPMKIDLNLSMKQDINPVVSPGRTLENLAWTISRKFSLYQITIDLVYKYHLQSKKISVQRHIYNIQPTNKQLHLDLPWLTRSPITHCPSMFQANTSEWSSRDCTITTRAPYWWQIPHQNFPRRQIFWHQPS
jgi:hypothetical protein